jgi:hypothetical protein
MALARYFEGMECLQLMSSKWTDAALQFVAFANTGCLNHVEKDPRTAQKILESRKLVLHWLSLMHGLGMQRVSGRDPDYKAFTVAQFPQRGCTRKTQLDMVREEKEAISDKPRKSLRMADAEMLGAMPILGPVTDDEENALEDCMDPVQVISHWICQVIARMRMDGWIDAHPAIVSRIYQELSNGSLGYAQALKVSLIPFPFPYAQMLALLLIGFMILFPMMVCYLNPRDRFFSPLLSFVGVLGLWSLNELAVELEMPFGDDENDLPIVDLHDLYIKGLQTLFLANDELLVDEVEGYVPPRKMKALTERLNEELNRMGSRKRFAASMTDDDYTNCSQQLLESDLGIDASIVILSIIKEELAED